jgi:hypothetical protein
MLIFVYKMLVDIVSEIINEAVTSRGIVWTNGVPVEHNSKYIFLSLT